MFENDRDRDAHLRVDGDNLQDDAFCTDGMDPVEPLWLRAHNPLVHDGIELEPFLLGQKR